MKTVVTIGILCGLRVACMAAVQPARAVTAPLPSSSVASSVALSTTTAPDVRTNEQKLSDPDATVRRNAVILIGAVHRPASFPALAALLADPSVDVRRAAVNAVAQSDPTRAAKALVDRYQTESSMAVKLNIISVLGDLKSVPAVPLLRAALDDPYPQFRSEAVRALGAVNTPACREAILTALSDEAEAVRIAAADAAGRTGLTEAIPLLEKNLSDHVPMVRRASTIALTAIGGPAALSALRKVQNDPDMSVRTPALEGIKKLTPADTPAASPGDHE